MDEIMKNHDGKGRLPINSTKICSITLKDRKDNFVNHPTVRQSIQPKTSMIASAKGVIDKINNRLNSSLNFNFN